MIAIALSKHKYELVTHLLMYLMTFAWKLITDIHIAFGFVQWYSEWKWQSLTLPLLAFMIISSSSHQEGSDEK